MQIDFHHAVTYVVARFAGFDAAAANIIANAAQYVDDSTESGYVHFDNGMRFFRQATAHPPLDLKNLDNIMRSAWKLFHDAAKAQRYDVFTHVLPEFGILMG